MNKSTKIWLITAISLIVIGCILFVGAMMALNFDFKNLSTVKYETNDYVISDTYKNVTVITDTADIKFIPSEETSVVCHEETKAKHRVEVKDDTLVIAIDNNKKWYDYIGIFNLDKTQITVNIPAGEYGDITIKSSTGNVELPRELNFKNIDISESTGDVTNFASASDRIKISTSTGNIRVEGITAGVLDLSVSTGKITVTDVAVTGDINLKVSTGKSYLTDVACLSLISTGNTGDITLKNVIAEAKFDIVRSTGDVKLEGCDAAELRIETDTGDVVGTLLSEKIFITESDTGRIDVPKTINGGRCEIITDTGDIGIEIE
ncbi:MAG: DUF4097 family beta strand repeat protein [Clostridia bacterium]|nr:DUF4097 family beta strand repeat protein [Clostridia bacterium]